MPKFSFTITVTPERALFNMSTDDPGVTVGMAAAPLVEALRWALANSGVTCLTNEEVTLRNEVAERRRKLPDGWEPTLDGVSTSTTDGVTCHARTYRYKGGDPVEAPCAADGSNLPATRDVLTVATPPEA